MPVPVADEHVHEPRGEERAGVDAVARVVLEMLEQALGRGQLHRPRECHLVVGGLRGALLDHPDHEAGAHAVEASQARVVRQQRDLGRRVQDARCVEQWRHHQRAAGMRRADLVLDHVPRERGSQVGWQRQRRVLVDRAKHILPAVPAQEAQRLGLTPATAAGGSQPAAEARQVDYRDLDGRAPEVAVMRTQQDAMQPPRAVMCAGDDGASLRRHRATGRLSAEGGRRQRRREPQAEERPTRSAQSIHSPKASAADPSRSTTITPSRARPSRRKSIRMKPLALRAKRVRSSATTRS